MDSVDPLRPERVGRLCSRFGVSLNHAICLALRQTPGASQQASGPVVGEGKSDLGASNGRDTARPQRPRQDKYAGGTDPRHLHVLSVMLVKGVPFYGYHVGWSYWLKVSLSNPGRMWVALEQLRKPVVLGREWQPHEAHLNHVLQFMCDFDLYGCGWLELEGGTFREPLPEGDPFQSPQGPVTHFNNISTPSYMKYPPNLSPPKDTYTPLEIDVLPQHILNRRRLASRNLHHDFIELLHRPLDPNQKLVPAVKELWDDERRRRAAKGLSLSETAMMPGSGGMGGHTMAELGYKMEGEERKNRGGDWKISEELWEMIEQRMDEERRKRGKLTFERFITDVTGGKGGEKRKYDKWVMTTFEAVSAHWPRLPKPPKSTQRSKRSRRSTRPSSPIPSAPTSPFPLLSSPEKPHTSPIKPLPPLFDVKRHIDLPEEPPPPDVVADVADPEEFTDDESDEENPFELFALTQLPQEPVPVEVNQYAISSDVLPPIDEEDETEAERAHENAAKLHAEEAQKLRATQISGQGSDYGSEFGDEEVDELFRRTVGGSATSTPRKRRVIGLSTPTTGGTTTASASGDSLTTRRERRDLRMRQQAGLGDLSTIFDASSISLTPDNPFSEGDSPRTPSKSKTPVSERPTPTSLIRNIFSKNRRGSPFASPTRRLTAQNAIVLPPSRRSLGEWRSTSPDDALVERETTPTPTASKVELKDGLIELDENDVNAETEVLREIMIKDDSADIEIMLPPAQRRTSSTPDSDGDRHPSSSSDSTPTRKRKIPSPTLRNDVDVHDNLTSHDIARTEVVAGSNDKPRKRVRMASPCSSSNSSNPQVRSTSTSLNNSQHLVLSGDTLSSTDASLPATDTTSAFPSLLCNTAWTYSRLPPSRAFVKNTMEEHGVHSIIYREPFYSNPTDVPSRAKLFAGRMFTLRGNGLRELEEFHSMLPTGKRWLKTLRKVVRSEYGWEYGLPPPSKREVVKWYNEQTVIGEERGKMSQLEGPTQKNKWGFKFSQKKKTRDSERERQNMSVLALEVFATSRHQLLPDPEKDPLTAVFFCYQNEDESLPDNTSFPGYYAGYAVVDSPQSRPERMRLDDEIPHHLVDSELDLINWVIDLVKDWDPDVLAGWELHNGSWGYLAARAEHGFSLDLTDQLSRVITGHTGPKKDFYSATQTSTFKVSGRHILNIWRICRSELNLTQYTFENVAFHLLHQRVPHYSAANLTALWKGKMPSHTLRVIKYLLHRVVMYMEMVDAAEIITKNAEFARVFGVDFASVMFRGSQYKVESFMFRIAKPESFVLVSPSKQQVGLQNAPFAVPLIAEPESKFYTHPILVLDFQSLYPSVMIAYNICFSTCLGRVEKFRGTDKFGFTELKVDDGVLELLKDYLTAVTPNGMIFVKPAVRKSLLSKMLGEILDTRVMVKQAMKGARGDKSLLQLLNARQLGLKLMANVTYGYTSATYSGRMPCIEVADSIVQTGRETLEKAQEMIHSNAAWGAQVVYGDTDSLFVALPGKTKDQAFVIGNQIADAVTAANPKPVKLKFEKVYMGSVLMAKKRYVGFKYEHPDETEPVFDAKGIETIRRDGFPAQGKIEEVCLKMLFRNQDLSQIKEFCRQEWTKILQGRISLQDFIVAKEVRLGSYSDKGVPPPGAAVAYRRILKDPRDEPQYAERVPYVISNAEGRRLIDRARTPEEMLANRSLGIDAEYYIRNLLIPPLSRIFNLVGADVESWYESMPRTKRAGKYDRSNGKMRIDSHFRSSHCVVCGGESSTDICRSCRHTPSSTSHALLSREHLAQSALSDFHRICASCSSTPPGEVILCDSVDCPVLYAKVKAEREMEDLGGVREVIGSLE
ncbi:hypothetical protein M231_07268 [Tremella mesenterica]|uniref:DNA polymerase n=1 Tax=Tremella mesenterica TaxID=5217 RepID=A0A4V1M335_TREME|nr:hypothetical protein M231_07268 [Tremella mesenterica]